MEPFVDFLCGVKFDYDIQMGFCALSQEREIADLVMKYDLDDNIKNRIIPMDTAFDFSDVLEDNVLPDVPYRSLLGSLLWLGRNSRPDILPSVSVLSRYTANYTMYHWKGLINILRYLDSTKEVCLEFKAMSDEEMILQSSTTCVLESSTEVGAAKSTSAKSFKIKKAKNNMKTFVPLVQYCDSDWASCKQTRRSTTGAAILLYGNLISWTSTRQEIVARSSVEAEYIAAGLASKDGVYVSNLLTEIFNYDDHVPLHLHCDNKGAIHVALNEVNNNRTKHIDIRHHYIREMVKNGRCFIHKVHTDDNMADMFTKPLAAPKFEKFRGQLMTKQ
jgi:hypothetical protein